MESLKIYLSLVTDFCVERKSDKSVADMSSGAGYGDLFPTAVSKAAYTLCRDVIPTAPPSPLPSHPQIQTVEVQLMSAHALFAALLHVY